MRLACLLTFALFTSTALAQDAPGCSEPLTVRLAEDVTLHAGLSTLNDVTATARAYDEIVLCDEAASDDGDFTAVTLPGLGHVGWAYTSDLLYDRP